MMGFIYPRLITVWRLPAQNLAGAQGDVGPTPTDMVQQPSGSPISVPAAVQMKKDSGAQPAKLPSDVSKRVYWEVLTQPGVPQVAIQSNDQIRDDLGNKYQVVGSYLTSFGAYQCMCERIEA